METIVARSEFLQGVAAAAEQDSFKIALAVRASWLPLGVKNYSLGMCMPRHTCTHARHLLCSNGSYHLVLKISDEKICVCHMQACSTLIHCIA
eukprot:SAG11_NODE_5170_length_1641_cov_1.225681_1_plen_93_part_00